MPDIVRTIPVLLTQLFQDGQVAGSITPQDMRDFIVTMAAMAGWGDPTMTTAAAAGTTQGTATVLASYRTLVTTGALNSGVMIAAPTLTTHSVINRTGNPIRVYPRSGMAIENLAANAAVTIPDGCSVDIVASTATQCWIIGGLNPPLLRLATAPTNLATGDVWRNGNVLNIV